MSTSLAAIEAADKAATPGPWATRHREDLDWLSQASPDPTHQPGSGIVPAGGTDLTTTSVWPNRNAREDAELIALYRNESPALVAALRAVLALIEPRLVADALHPDAPPQKVQRVHVRAADIRKAITDAGVEP